MSTFSQFPRCCCAVIFYRGLVLTYSSSYVFSTHILGYKGQYQPWEGGFLLGIPLITLLPQYLVERAKLQLCSIVKHLLVLP